MPHLVVVAMCFIGAILSCAYSRSVSAHPGGLDANGCHHNRRRGDYHCHLCGQRYPLVRPSLQLSTVHAHAGPSTTATEDILPGQCRPAEEHDVGDQYAVSGAAIRDSRPAFCGEVVPEIRVVREKARP